MTRTIIDDYLVTVGNQNQNTAKVVGFYLADYDRYNSGDTDQVITDGLKTGKVDVYIHLNGYVSFLVKKGTQSARSIGFNVKAVKHFLDVCDVNITDHKFRIKVKLPRAIKPEMPAMTKADVSKIINACEDIRLRTYVMFLAGTGMRATEALMLKIKDFDFNKSPIRINIPGENTKTKTDRHFYLTEEMAKALNDWLNYKYRPRTIKSKNSAGKWNVREVVPQRSPNDYVFLAFREGRDNKKINFNAQYIFLGRRFSELVKRLAFTDKISFHSFRRHVYSTIDGLGLNQFAEWALGHATSAYWVKPEAEKIDIFRRIEPYLTYCDVKQLEQVQADIQSQIGTLTSQNLMLKTQLAGLTKALQEVGIMGADGSISLDFAKNYAKAIEDQARKMGPIDKKASLGITWKDYEDR